MLHASAHVRASFCGLKRFIMVALERCAVPLQLWKNLQAQNLSAGSQQSRFAQKESMHPRYSGLLGSVSHNNVHHS
jgi:hypothetical protein